MRKKWKGHTIKDKNYLVKINRQNLIEKKCVFGHAVELKLLDHL